MAQFFPVLGFQCPEEGCMQSGHTKKPNKVA